MENGSEGANASVLFGLSGFRVCAQTMHEGEWLLAVETRTVRAACPSCGVFGVGNGRRRVLVRDLPIAGSPVIVVWVKRTWRCCEELCERGSWSEMSEQIAPRASMTERARREICRRVGQDLDTVAEMGRVFGVGWSAAHRAVIDYGDVLIAGDQRQRTIAEQAPIRNVRCVELLTHHRLHGISPQRNDRSVCHLVTSLGAGHRL